MLWALFFSFLTIGFIVVARLFCHSMEFVAFKLTTHKHTILDGRFNGHKNFAPAEIEQLARNAVGLTGIGASKAAAYPIRIRQLCRTLLLYFDFACAIWVLVGLVVDAIHQLGQLPMVFFAGAARPTVLCAALLCIHSTLCFMIL